MASLRTAAGVLAGLFCGLVFACGGSGSSTATSSGTTTSSSSSTTSSSTSSTSSSTGSSTSSSGAGGQGGQGGKGAGGSGGAGVGGAGGAGGGVNAPCKVDADCKPGLMCTCPNDACHDCGGMTGSCVVACMGG